MFFFGKNVEKWVKSGVLERFGEGFWVFFWGENLVFRWEIWRF